MFANITAVLISLRKGPSSIGQFLHIRLTYTDEKTNLLLAEQNRKNQDKQQQQKKKINNIKSGR